MQPLGIAVIGLGWWGRIIVPLAKTSARLHVVKGVDPAPAAKEFAAAQGVAYESSFEAALADPAVQAVVLCTPHTRHTEQIGHSGHPRGRVRREVEPPHDRGVGGRRKVDDVLVELHLDVHTSLSGRCSTDMTRIGHECD